MSNAILDLVKGNGDCKDMIETIDTYASCNEMTFQTYEELGLRGMVPMKAMMLLLDGSRSRPMGLVEDVVLKLDRVNVILGFVIVESVKDESKEPGRDMIILGRPFLNTTFILIPALVRYNANNKSCKPT